MPIDFAPLLKREVNPFEYSQQYSIDDLREASNTSLDILVDIINQATDEQITFIPHDPDAHDPDAVAGEEHIGWSLGHLVLHATATAEEGFSRSSILARGIVLPSSLRLRYEDSWHTHCQTRADCLHRLEESRRMRLAYLDAWPDRPHLDVFLEPSPDTPFRFQINALVSALLGLTHEIQHHDQFREALRQAQAAHPSGA